MKASVVRKAIYSLVLGFLIFGVSGSIGAIAQGGDLLTVCAAGPPACSTTSLQEAAAVASDGSTIFVDPGQYSGPVIVSKNLTIIGSGSEQTVVTRGIIAAGPFFVTLRALQVTGGLNGIQAQAAPGLPEIFAPVLSIESVKVTGNAGNGVALFNGSSAILTNVEIVQNGITVQGQPVGGGIAVRGTASLTVTGTSVISMSGANGISANDNATVSISGNTSISMSQLSGVQIGGSATASISNLTVEANGCYGLDVADNSTVNVSGGTYAGNAAAGIRVGGPSSALIGCGTNTDSVLHATATIEGAVITGNPIGLLVGDLSKDLEQATVTTVGVRFIGNGQNVVIDPVDTKNVDIN